MPGPAVADVLDGFTRVDVCSVAEAEAVAADVLAHRASWVRRSDHDFFTFGRALYLDAVHDDQRRRYPAAIRSANAVLLTALGPFYAELRRRMGVILGARTAYHPSLALPGFHVLLEEAIPHLGAADVHCDLQFLPLLDPSAAVLAGDLVSFTLPLRLPQAGAGLNVFPARWDPAAGAVAADPDTGVRLDYRVGELVLHDGLTLHQMAASGPVVDGDVRLTLQGHGLKIDEVVYLYW